MMEAGPSEELPSFSSPAHNKFSPFIALSRSCVRRRRWLDENDFFFLLQGQDGSNLRVLGKSVCHLRMRMEMEGSGKRRKRSLAYKGPPPRGEVIIVMHRKCTEWSFGRFLMHTRTSIPTLSIECLFLSHTFTARVRRTPEAFLSLSLSHSL